MRGGLKLTHSESERWRWFALGFGKDVADRHHLLWTLGAYGSPSLVERRFGSDRDAILGARRLLYTTYGQLGLGQQVSVAGLLLEASTTMVIWSRLAERFGVALPCPYTSPRTIRLVTGIPWKIRLAEPKHLVRALLRREGVPESLIARPKLSFGFPYRHWAVRGALLQPLVDMAGTMFEPELLRSFQTEQWGEAMILWNAVGLYLWRSLIVEGADPDALVEEVLARHRARVGAGRAG